MKFLLLCLFSAGMALAQAVHITNGPVVEHVGADSAVIAWSTDGPSSTVLHYGADGALDQRAAGEESSGTHRVELKDLLSGSTYSFMAESNGAYSDVRTFTTPVPENLGNPVSSMLPVGPIVQEVTGSGARIWWFSTRSDAMKVRYGTDKSRLSMTATPVHGQVQLRSLEPDTAYYFSLFDETEAPIASGSFITEPSGSVGEGRVSITSGPVIEFLDYNAAVIAWSTNVNASTLIRYSQDPNNLNKTAVLPETQETHRLTLKDLESDATYYFVVESAQKQGSGAMAKGSVGRFHTNREGERPLRNIIPPSSS